MIVSIGLLHRTKYVSVSFNFPRVVYEGLKCEYETEGLANEEDVQYYFRVAAVNDVGIGPYCVSVCYTKEKACELYMGIHERKLEIQFKMV